MTRGRFALAVTSVGTIACVFVTGCLLPYAYPKLDYVPGTDTRIKAADVHAFRVDVTADQADIGENGTFSLTPIPLEPESGVPPQVGLSVERGIYVFGVALNFNIGRRHDTRVRLYSRGYQLVELKPWESPDAVQWRLAQDWSAQEKAIDDLLRRPIISNTAAAFLQHDAEREPPQSDLVRTKATMQALFFAAAEYERVATFAPTPADADRLKKKAKDLRELAMAPK